MYSYLSFIFLFSVLSSSDIKSEQLTLSLDFNKKTLTINEVVFDEKSTLAEYEKVLGKASRIEKIADFNRIYAYDSLGISLSIKHNASLVEGFYITYEYDEDKKIAKGKFRGKIFTNGIEVREKLPPSELKKTTGLAFEGMMGMYGVSDKAKQVSIMLYYPDEKSNLIGQMLFGFGEPK